jgi:hypothetical protein
MPRRRLRTRRQPSTIETTLCIPAQLTSVAARVDSPPIAVARRSDMRLNQLPIALMQARFTCPADAAA